MNIKKFDIEYKFESRTDLFYDGQGRIYQIKELLKDRENPRFRNTIYAHSDSIVYSIIDSIPQESDKYIISTKKALYDLSMIRLSTNKIYRIIMS